MGSFENLLIPEKRDIKNVEQWKTEETKDYVNNIILKIYSRREEYFEILESDLTSARSQNLFDICEIIDRTIAEIFKTQKSNESGKKHDYLSLISLRMDNYVNENIPHGLMIGREIIDWANQAIEVIDAKYEKTFSKDFLPEKYTVH